MSVLKKLLPLSLLALTTCGTLPVHEGLDRVKIGMEKGEVLHLAGNPKHTHYLESKDHWIFDFYQDDKEMVREITFAEGRVVEIAPAHLRGQADEPAEETGDLEQYENKVRESQKQHQGSFEDVPEQ